MSASHARSARDRRRDHRARDEHHLGREHLLLVEPLPARVVEASDRQLLEQQRAVDQTRVHVQEQLRVERVVPQTGHRVDPVDPRVDLVDLLGGRVGLRLANRT